MNKYILQYFYLTIYIIFSSIFYIIINQFCDELASLSSSIMINDFTCISQILLNDSG
jgi:hypothetical protein